MNLLVHGDALLVLRDLPDNYAHTCVTSPPYFGLRDYGVDGQIGLEPSPETYVEKLVEVFHEVRRVLREDGTCWVNMGDSYAATGKSGSGAQGKSSPASSAASKPKNLLGIPWRVAFALQADGWCLRQDIIWHKPNPMPESVRDRCTKAHEYLFLLSKSPRYYFDSEAIKYDCSKTAHPGRKDGRVGAMYEAVGGQFNNRRNSWKSTYVATRANKRSVWTVTTKPYRGAHFATFPPDLIEPCILAGAPVGGVVLDPFLGSGTTAAVALALGRRYLGIELNAEYVTLARQRIARAASAVAA